MAKDENRKVQTMSSGNKALAQAPVGDGLMALVFFDLSGGEAMAKEVRLLPTARASSARKLLSDWEPGEGRVSSSVLRSVPLVAMRQAIMREQALHSQMFEAYDVRSKRRVEVPGYEFRRPQDRQAAIERAQVAIRYEELVLNGEPEPTRRIGDEFFDGDSVKARNVVAAARKAEFLTSSAPGTAGGRTTAKLRNFWKALKSAHDAADS
ncbi:hypothetical protein OAV85_02465 [Candidatus Nanopelagicales bacterium]|nr:hypothetical protein [Candidatus Nanopelagicales bacterium]